MISTYILGDSKTIVFAPLPTKDTQELHTQFLPLVDFLEKKLNVKIKIDYNSDYEKLLAKFIIKEIDIAYLGPLPYAYLEDRYEYATPLVNFKNSKGEVSDRDINISKVTAKDGKVTISAYCFASEAPKAFSSSSVIYLQPLPNWEKLQTYDEIIQELSTWV